MTTILQSARYVLCGAFTAKCALDLQVKNVTTPKNVFQKGETLASKLRACR